jgi:uncharacterized protein (TIRG00374 family)
MIRLERCADLLRSRWFGFSAKGAVSAGVFYLSVRHLGVATVFEKLHALDWWAIALGIVICVLQNGLTAVRWRWIIGFLGEKLSLWRAVCIVEMCSFIGQALPATVGSDAVRVLQAWQYGVSMQKAVTSVLFDRSAGISGIIIAGLIGLPLASRRVGNFETQVLLLGGVALVAGVVALIFRRHWLSWLPGKLAAAFSRFFDLIVDICLRPSAWAWTILPSIVVQLLSTVVVYVALRQFGVEIGFFECVLSVTLGLLVAGLPVSIGGWGVREGAFVVALGAVGVPPAEAIASSVLTGVAQFVAAVPGGVLLLFYRPERLPRVGN